MIHTSYTALTGGIRQGPDAAGIAGVLMAMELPAYGPRLVPMPMPMPMPMPRRPVAVQLGQPAADQQISAVTAEGGPEQFRIQV